VNRGVLMDFYQSAFGAEEDPFGHRWTLSTHVEDVPPDMMNARMKEMLGG